MTKSQNNSELNENVPTDAWVAYYALSEMIWADAFDIYLAIQQNRPILKARKLLELLKDNKEV